MGENLYNKLKYKKENGEKLDWDKITKEELEELFEEDIPDSMVSDLYNVSQSKVTYKRKKWNINMRSSIRKQIIESDLYQGLNAESKKRLFDRDNLENISKALTHYIFRNGPVEDMHGNGKLSQQDMKILNKFMVDRIAGILETIYEGDWLKLELLLDFYSNFGTNWDKPNPDKKEIELLYKKSLEIE